MKSLFTYIQVCFGFQEFYESLANRSLAFLGLDQSDDEEDLGQSYDITMENQDMFYRQRTNTAQKLERMSIARRKAALIKSVKCDDSLISSQESSSEADLFVKKNLKDFKESGKQTSMLAQQMELLPSLPQNKFTKYAVFDGTSQTGIPTKTMGIFVSEEPEHFKNYPLQLCVISSAKIEEFIGFIMYKCKVEHPDFEFSSVKDYGLFITDDGEPEYDLPPLDVKEAVQRFQFNHLALAKRMKSHFERTFSYTEGQGQSQVKVEPMARQASLTETSRSVQPRGTAEQQMDQHDSMIESYFYSAYRLYFITRKHFKVEVQLGISGEKIEIDPIQQKNTNILKKIKAIHYSMDSVAFCDFIEQKPNRVRFRITYSLSFTEQGGGKYGRPSSSSQLLASTSSSAPLSSSEYHMKPQLQSSASFKNHDFETDPKTADEIVRKINNILQLRTSVVRREFLNRNQKTNKSFMSKKKFPI